MTRRVKSILCMLMALVLFLPGTGISTKATSEEGTDEHISTVEIFGKQVDSNAEILDLNNIPLESTAQVEEILPLFPNLKQVEMCQCGISNEEMAALNQKYPDIKFVWEVTVCKYYEIRTDATYFMPFQLHMGKVSGGDYSNLKYCTEIQLIDFGHYPVEDTSFVAYMPNLKYLLLCDSTLADISDIGNCTSLEFLELFVNPVDDFAPLLNLTNLKDLNISFTPFTKGHGTDYAFTGDFGDITPLYQMTWLDRLWMCTSRLPQEELDELQSALSHTTIVYASSSSTDKGWRHSPHYYAGRDLIGGVYMFE